MFLSQIALMKIILHIACSIFAFYILDCLKVDVIFKKGHTPKIRMFYILLAILLGTSMSNFIIDIFVETQNLQLLFS